MKLDLPGAPHLTYCTNIHAGETWTDIRANLEEHVVRVRSLVAPDRPFGVGLRLSGTAANALVATGEIEKLQELLERHGLYVFTLNGFPYGPFHGRRVKEDVYLPDWLDEERLRYTNALAHLLAVLLPSGMEGSVSTVPGAFRTRVRSEGGADAIADMLLRHVAELVAIADATEKVIALALEPEPCCYLETVAESIRFFEDRLLSYTGVARLAELTGRSRAESTELIVRHLGVCFDACHMAVEFEEPAAALAAYRDAGIRIPKLQVSAGLIVDPAGEGALDALRPFAEGVYLHQVVERRDGVLTRWLDLPDALAAARGRDLRHAEWRVHFHVPIFREELGRFRSTQAYLAELLTLVRDTGPAPHLEVETYTWDVLPPEYRTADMNEAIARELTWTRDRLQG